MRRSTGRTGRTTRGTGAALLAALSLGSLSACGSDDADGALVGDAYVDAMADLCRATDDRLAALPAPPEQISADDWATEVGRALRAEADRADALVVDAEIRGEHGTFTRTTADLAATYDELSAALALAGDDITAISTEITELSLGRDDVAGRLGLDACVRSDR